MHFTCWERLYQANCSCQKSSLRRQWQGKATFLNLGTDPCFKIRGSNEVTPKWACRDCCRVLFVQYELNLKLNLKHPVGFILPLEVWTSTLCPLGRKTWQQYVGSLLLKAKSYEENSCGATFTIGRSMIEGTILAHFDSNSKEGWVKSLSKYSLFLVLRAFQWCL